MGGIKSHGKGIQVTFYWNGERYRPTLRIEPTPTNIKYATRLKGEIEKSIALGTYTLKQYALDFPTSKLAKAAPTVERETFNTMSNKWIKSVSNLTAGTIIKYKQSLSFWKEKIGDMPIETIQYSTVVGLANSQEWKAGHRRNMLIPLRCTLELAFLDGVIESNPTLKIKNTKSQRVPPDPLTGDEVKTVLAHIKGKYPEQIYNLFQFSFGAGLRPSEYISLKWGDIDFVRRKARVQRAKTYGVEHETKTFSIRDIELNAMAWEALTRQKAHTFLRDEYVFYCPRTNNQFLNSNTMLRTYWKPTLKALGMRARAVYQTRHTYATLNLMAGANPMWVSRQMGHANMGMLLTVYAKWIDGADKSKESAKFDALFSSIATAAPQDNKNIA